MAKIDWDELVSYIAYDAETGKAFWKERLLSSFKTPAACKRWNKQFFGKELGCADSEGYRVACFKRVQFKVHIAIWYLYYGVLPENLLDHEDGVRDNNKIKNLRKATNTENQWNAKPRENCVSSHKGVHFYRGKWVSRIQISRKRVFLGRFETEMEAHRAYQKAAQELQKEFAWNRTRYSVSKKNEKIMTNG